MNRLVASKYGIQCGPITNQIWIGKLNKSGTMFLDGETTRKEDHTNLAINAVIEHVMAKFKGEMIFDNGSKKYEVTIKELP